MIFSKKIRAALLAALMAGILSFQSLAVSGVVNCSSVLNFRQSASLNGEILGKIPSGTKIDINSITDNWCNITYNGTSGFVYASYVQVEKTVATVKANGGLNLRAGADVSAGKLAVIPNGAKVEILSSKNGWSNILYNSINGYVASNYLVTGDTVSRSLAERTGYSSNTADDLVTYAKSFLGVPYVYGGASPKGFDCSGYVQYVYAHLGYTLPRTATSQAASSLCVAVTKSELLPGDLVFFKLPGYSKPIGHVGIYVGEGKFIHASSPGDVVKYSSLSSSYYTRNYVTARRIIQ
jgi:cell wall-associated NlpC family hydrolase